MITWHTMKYLNYSSVNPKANLEGVDDGLTTDRDKEKPTPETELKPRIRPSQPPSQPPADYPYTPLPVPRGRRPLDVNLYATKKTVAQGMMDLALLTANANQLRYVLESNNIGPYYYFSVVLISLSIILQILGNHN
ncbi:Ninjurin-1 [Armadillidium vulgare]|nr:Ninjurin-1 [Armadillidium vulgare]